MHVCCIAVSADVFTGYVGHADVHCLVLHVEAVASDGVDDLSTERHNIMHKPQGKSNKQLILDDYATNFRK